MKHLGIYFFFFLLLDVLMSIPMFPSIRKDFLPSTVRPRDMDIPYFRDSSFRTLFFKARFGLIRRLK